MSAKQDGRLNRSLDHRVNRALFDIEAGDIRGLEDLYELLSRPVYVLCKLNTQHVAVAERATVEAFRRVWAASGRRPSDSRTGIQWVLDLACRCARETQAIEHSQYAWRGVSQPAV